MARSYWLRDAVSCMLPAPWVGELFSPWNWIMLWWSAANFTPHATLLEPASNRLDGHQQRTPLRRLKADPDFVEHHKDQNPSILRTTVFSSIFALTWRININRRKKAYICTTQS